MGNDFVSLAKQNMEHGCRCCSAMARQVYEALILGLGMTMVMMTEYGCGCLAGRGKRRIAYPEAEESVLLVGDR